MKFGVPDDNVAFVVINDSEKKKTAPSGAHLSPEEQFLMAEKADSSHKEEPNLDYQYIQVLKVCQEFTFGSYLLENGYIGFDNAVTWQTYARHRGWKVNLKTRRKISDLIYQERCRGCPILSPPKGRGYCLPSPENWRSEVREWEVHSKSRGKNIFRAISSVLKACGLDVLDGQSVVEEFYNGTE